MALTLEVEQRLEAAGLIELFDDDRAVWIELSKQAHGFLRGNFPADSRIRPDDVAKALVPIVEVHEGLRAYLSEHKLKQKYWISDFTDLVIDRTWEEIQNGGQNAN